MALDFPSNPVDGQVYGNFYWDVSMSAWRATGTVSAVTPAGVVSQYMGSTAPSGYLLCNGQSVTTAAYSALFAVIGYTYGGSGANFTIPNMQGRIPVGAGSITDPNSNSQTFTLAGTGGELSHKLTTAELASHTHIQNAHTHTQDAHTHPIANGGYPAIINFTASGGNSAYMGQGAGSGVWSGGVTATNQNTTATNQNTGGDGFHNNLQPYIVVNYIIKT